MSPNLDQLNLSVGDLVRYVSRDQASVGIIVFKHDDLWFQVLWDDVLQTKDLVWRLEAV